MSMVDFSRGELSPLLRYRRDLEAYHKGVEVLERFMPTARGGLTRGPGCQVLELLPPSDRPPAVRMFSLGSTGLDSPISAVGSEDTVTIGTATYNTEFRVHDIPKDEEIDILLSFSEYGEADDIVAYWVNTPDGNPAFLQRVFNYDPGFDSPPIDFDDTRDVRVVQVENNVYIIAKTQIYRLFWDKNKVIPEWDSEATYSERDVVQKSDHFFECKEGPSTNQDPTVATSEDYWRVVYPPLISWETVSPRVGYELLKGIGTDDDPYTWTANAVWADNTTYYKGDVVYTNLTYYECTGGHTTGTVGSYKPTGDAQAWDGNWVELTDLSGVDPDTIEEQDDVYRRSSYAFREETVPRQMVVHHNRLIFAGSAIRPSTIYGSEVYHYLNFGAGINDDEPWIVTVTGDKVGRILWMTVTDQLYIGTSGGIFAVSGVLTPTSFQLRKVTSHATSDIEAVAAAGSVIFFHKDKMTLREIEYSDQAESYRAFDLTVFSDHLFDEFKAVKMVVVNDPSIVIWILREDGTLVSLSYEKTVNMYAFSRHELHGKLYDIVAGKNGELYGVIILDDTDVRQLVRIGEKSLVYNDDELTDIRLDGLVSFVNTDPANTFATQILNESVRDWYEANGITSVSAMFGWTGAIDASEQNLSGELSNCGLNYLDEAPSLDLSGNALTGNVPANLVNLMSNATGAALNLSGNPLTMWDITEIPDSWLTVNLADTSFPIGQVGLILDSVIASNASSPRSGVLDLTGLGVLSAEDHLGKAVDLLGAGWSVLIDNDAGWDTDTVAFNGNGSTGGSPPSSIGCLYMEEITLPSGYGTLERTGYEFAGWASTSGGASEYLPGETYKKTSQGPVTLYAVWILNNGVAYSANGGSGTIPVDSNLYNPGDMVTVKASSLTKLGYTFLGWSKTIGGTIYTTGMQFEMGETAVTLTARWRANTYTVSFSLNGAQQGAVPATFTVTYGDDPFTLPAPTATIHREVSDEYQTFRRWNTAANYSGDPRDVGSTYIIPAMDITFYAEFRDYEPGDDGPHGGVITQDLGGYAYRPINKDLLAASEGDYTWRYIEMMKTDYSSPTGAFPGGVYMPVIDGVRWFAVREEYLKEALMGGELPNLLQTYYWTGYSHKKGFWLFYTTYYHYMHATTAAESDTSDGSQQYGRRLGRGT